MKGYRATIQSGATAIPEAVEMERMFPQTDHFITHFGFDSSPKQWNSEAFFGKRYILTMQVSVDVDYSSQQVSCIGEPKFYLNEVATAQPLSHGRFELTHGRTLEFGREEWKQLVEAKGDLNVLGFAPTPSVVPNYSEAVEAIRRDRVPVSLRTRMEGK